MYRKIASGIMVAWLKRDFIRHIIQIPPEEYSHSNDGKTLNLMVTASVTHNIEGLRLSGIMGMPATEINDIVEQVYMKVQAFLSSYYDYVLVREDGYYDSLGFVVFAEQAKAGLRESIKLRDFVQMVVHNAYRDMYRNVGFNLIVEKNEVVGLKRIDIKDAERKLYQHYKAERDDLDRYDHEQTNVYPFKRIRNRLKLYKQK